MRLAPRRCGSILPRKSSSSGSPSRSTRRDRCWMVRPAFSRARAGRCGRRERGWAARYAVEVNGFPPAIGTGPLEIRAGRHPLLLGANESAVVSFDLVLAPDERTVLVSGPNTGGKTVLIKAVGLLSLMAQSGIIPPIGPQSTLPVFTGVFADIGDRQSIAASLSTF